MKVKILAFLIVLGLIIGVFTHFGITMADIEHAAEFLPRLGDLTGVAEGLVSTIVP